MVTLRVEVAQLCRTLCNPVDCPWNSAGQNPGVGSLALLQGIFPTQGSNPGLLHCRRILYQRSHQGSPVTLKAWANVSGFRVGGYWGRPGGYRRHKGDGGGQWERCSRAARSPGQCGQWRRNSGQDLGLCRAAGPPLRGISTQPFPCLFLTLLQPPALSLGGRLFTPASNRVHWPWGPGAQPTGTCYLLPGLPVNQVKGWGAGRGLASKGSDFLPLILLFDLPPLQRDLFIETSRSIETGSPAFAVVKMPDGWLGAGRSPGCSLAPRALGPKFQFGGMCRPWLLQEMAVLSLQGPVVPEMLLAFLHSEFLFFSPTRLLLFIFLQTFSSGDKEAGFA